MNFEYLQAHRENVDITFHWNKKLEQYEDSINVIFYALEFGLLATRERVQIQRKCKQFFEFLEPKKSNPKENKLKT